MSVPENSAQTWQGETGFIKRTLLKKYVNDLRSPIYYVAGLPEMVNAMQAVLADVGVNKDNIRAEELLDSQWITAKKSPIQEGRVIF